MASPQKQLPNLNAFLFGREAGNGVSYFENPSSLARSLAALDDSCYPNIPGTKALLSQILRGKKPMPDALKKAIAASLSQRLSGERDIGPIISRFEKETWNHNEMVSSLRSYKEKDDDWLDLWLGAADKNATEQFSVLSEAAYEDNGQVLSGLFRLYFLDIVGKGFESMTMNGAGGIGEVTLLPTPRLPESPLAVTIIVPSKAVALKIWSEVLMDVAWKLHEIEWLHRKVPSDISIEDRRRCSELIRGSAHVDNVKIWIVDQSYLPVCGTSVICLRPSDVSSVSVYGLIEGAVWRFPPGSAIAWRNHVYVQRFEFLKSAKQFRWPDAEEILLAKE